MLNTPSGVLFSELSIFKQRELLQQMNHDKLAGVFNFQGKDGGSIGYSLLNIENVLACYPNQLEDGQIKLPEDFENGDMVIINMGALRNGRVEVIAGKEENLPRDGQRPDLISEIDTPVLLSPGVIEYWEDEKTGKKYTQTVLRDGGQINHSEGITSLADANERTTTAGRNFSGRLHDDLEIENAEESPFLMQNESGKYFLVTHDLNYKSHLIKSIKGYLKNKYLSSDNKDYEDVKNAFEKKFKSLKYSDLGKILQEVIDNDRFQAYDWREGEIDGIDTKQITLGSEQGNFYIFYDKDNNTLEYRAIREITGFPQGLKPTGKIPLRLFLESQNQDPSFKNIKNISKNGARTVKLVPTIDDFVKRVNGII